MEHKDISFAESFARRLPPEIRQMVYKWAVVGSRNDIEINSDRDNVVSPEPSALECLVRLKESCPKDVYNEAIEYLTKPMFRWVFTSDSEPHRYLLKVFRKQAPPELRERIQYVYLRRMRVASLVNSMGFPSDTRNPWDLKLPKRSDYSEYLQRVSKKTSPDLEDFISPILSDIKIGMALLTQTLPSTSKLGIGLDLYDCTLLTYIRHAQSLISSISPLKGLENISKLDIQVFWGDHFGQGNATHGEREEEVKREMQESFVQRLREVVPAKCITGHDTDKIPTHSPNEC